MPNLTKTYLLRKRNLRASPNTAISVGAQANNSGIGRLNVSAANSNAANTNTAIINVPSNVIEAIESLKEAINKSDCKDTRIIKDRLSFLDQQVHPLAGGNYKTRKHRSRKNKKTRRH